MHIGVEETTNLGAYSNPSDVTNLALARYALTAPSAEQIAKIYNDEKHLFQTNAKATLYGTSDAVTALAYDDDTELLHVGTSAGRSEFQGLRRVNNTTDAVSAAISASNGFIVED
jgi:NADP-dependent 3-hydroxy acid dehydrogenase YdfG